MQKPTQKFRQGSIVFEKSGILPEKLSSIEFNDFCSNFAHVSYLPMGSKGCSRFVSFCLGSAIFAKMKRIDFHTLTETRFINNSGCKQNKNILNTLL